MYREFESTKSTAQDMLECSQCISVNGTIRIKQH